MIYDLIIVGGGPGGATAAEIAAQGSSKVLLLEAAEEGRYKCCAGGIPVSNEEFSPIPKNVGDREITGGVLVTPKRNPMDFKTTGVKDKGYCMFRTDFDKFLLDIAHDAGADIIFNFRVKHINNRKSKNVVIIGKQEYEAKSVILATGLGGARLQRSLGIEVPPMINGIQAEVALSSKIIDDQFGNRIWEFFDPSIVDHGIAWAFPKREAVSIGLLGDGAKMSNFQSFLKYPLIKEKMKSGEMMRFKDQKIWAAPIPDRMIKKPYTNNVMVVGDACGTADPILYEGIYQARLSGKLAAKVFIQANEEGDFSEEILKKYHELLINQLYNDNSRYAYKIHHLLYHSGLIDKIINASYDLAQKDSEMLQSMISLFSGSETRKEIWKVMMSKKWKLIKYLGLNNSLKLFPTLLKAYFMK
jgi:geranylgeranyl reductase family protein